MISGVFEYNKNSPSAMRSLLGILDIIVFFGIWAGFEFFYRKALNSYTPYKAVKYEVTSEEFIERIKKGEKLVILNDMVLDVAKY